MVNPLLCSLFLTCFKPEIISVFSLLLHDCTDMKSIFLYLVCKKGNPFTKKNISNSTLWWLLAMGVGKGILDIVCDDMVSFEWP